jgi:hypothetical protein
MDTDGNQTSIEAFFEVVGGTTVDDDGDGWTEDQGDCDDTDPSTHPNGREVANGVDDDCNGLVDDGTDAFDDDGDCYCETAPCAGSIEAACTTLEGDDCDDDAERIHPNATETCDGADEDCDGLTDEGTSCVDDDNDGYTELGGDCNDNDGTIRPGAPETADGVDQDCDGLIDEGTSAFDDDGDCYCESGACLGSVNANCSSVVSGDCNDNDEDISPAATEVCNSTDDNCDGTVDNNAQNATTYYADADGDQWGDINNTLAACSQPAGYVTNDDDCDDTSADISPVDNEVCNGLDDDCDGNIDEAGATGATTSYQDSDGDGFGNILVSSNNCTPPAGYVYDGTDCNDTNAATFPGATEYCDNIDNDCDGAADENSAVDTVVWYQDSDGDGYGDANSIDYACDAPGGYVASSNDCDDTDANIHPGAAEICDGIDQNCSGVADEGVAPTWYQDADGDTYGNANVTQTACSQPSGYVSNGNDCDDTDNTLSPTTLWYEDNDGDGYGTVTSLTQSCTQPAGYVSDSSDCNDSNASDNPLGSESCDGRDNDCDGTSDEANASGCTAYYYDSDGDGYGDGSVSSRCLCSGSGYYTSTNSSDCYDSNNAAYPGVAGYHQSDRGDGNYDWNCDGTEEKKYSNQYSCTILCGSYIEGWSTSSIPACGSSGTFRQGCSINLTGPNYCTYANSYSSTKQQCK